MLLGDERDIDDLCDAILKLRAHLDVANLHLFGHSPYSDLDHNGGSLGYYSEYLDKQLDFPSLTRERKAQLARISQLRGGRDVLVFAADLNKTIPQISITFDDLLPISDQLANLSGTGIDVILQTPGGSGEVAEDIVRLLRGKYPNDVAIIVPGWAKSAGTIMAMAADEILMEPISALGPIDAQLSWQGKVFSAHALLEGVEKIKKEVADTGTLNKAYIPILQAISPGELQSAQNALDFSQKLVTQWLANYKFKHWATHSSTGSPVTAAERQQRAEEIASQLCDHGYWLTHGRSIKLDDFAAMKLLITDYSRDTALAEAIRRYYTLLQMTFRTNMYKVVETVSSQVYRFTSPPGPNPQQVGPTARSAVIEIECNNCKAAIKVQANLVPDLPLESGNIEFPHTNRINCPSCGTELDLSDARRQIEAQVKKPVITKESN